MPDSVTGVATPAEYDMYFRLVRRSIGLSDWTRTCLTVGREVLADLDKTNLSDRERCDLLAGLVAVQEMTLARWLTIGSGMEDQP